MDPKTITETAKALGEALAPLTDKLGQSAETVFSWAIKANYATAITDIVIFLGSLLAAYFWYKLWCYGESESKNWEGRSNFDESGSICVLCVLMGVASIAFLIWGSASLFDSIHRFVSPELSALKDLLAAFNGQ